MTAVGCFVEQKRRYNTQFGDCPFAVAGGTACKVVRADIRRRQTIYAFRRYLNAYLCDDRTGRIRIANVRQLRRSRRRGHSGRSGLPGRVRADGTAIYGAVLALAIRRFVNPNFHHR